jgi:tetratricopeptide (TPR) repeat protein
MRDALPRRSHRLRRIAVSSLLCAAAATAGLRGQLAPSPAPDVAVRWVDAVDAYAAGDHVPAAQRVSTVDPDPLLAQGRREVDRWQSEGSDVARRRLRASAALAFELALDRLDNAGDAGPGRYIDLAETSLRALERARGGVETARFAALWRLAHLQLLLLGGQVTDVDARARRDDLGHLPAPLQAEWHVARGIGFETAARLSIGTTRVQQTPFGTTAMPRQLWVDRNRRRAIDHYRDALAVDEAHAETRLRLGRVLLESGQHQEARQHLDRAATDPCVSQMCGFAWLFLGEWHMTHGTPEGARRAFVRASGVLDIRQSALLGLLAATLASRPGAASELTRQFDAQAMLGRQDTADAWSRYLAGHPFGVATVRAALRDEASR